MSARSSRRPRRDLSLEEITRVATDLLADVDDSELTMRRLADACSVTPMALYNHVDDKEALLTHVVDAVIEPLAAFETEAHGDARQAFVDFGSLMRRLLLGHRGAATTYLRRPVLSPTMTRVTERFFELATALDPQNASIAETVDAVVLVTMGSIANDLTRPAEIRRQLAENEARPDAPKMVSDIEEYAGRDAEVAYQRAVGWIIDAACAGPSR